MERFCEHIGLAAIFLALLVVVVGCTPSETNSQQRTTVSQFESIGPISNLSVTQIVENISLIEDLTPKRGEPQTDLYAVAIISLGTNAGPLLLDKLLDDRKSKYAYLFQYNIAGIADALLCEIYHRHPLDALVANKQPLEPSQGHVFWDYSAFLNSREGRDELKAAWEKIIKSTERETGSEVLSEDKLK